MVDGSEVAVITRTLGFWVEVSTPGDLETDDTAASLVDETFPDVVDSAVGTAVVAVAVVAVGTGTGAVVVVRRGAAVSTGSVVRADILTAVDDAPDVVDVLGLGSTVGAPRVVDLVVPGEGLVAVVTLGVTGLMVDLSVDVNLGVTLAVRGTLGVVLRVDVCVMLVDVVAGVALDVDTSRVVTLSWIVVTLGATEEVVVWGEETGGGEGVVAFVETSTLPVAGCVVFVIG